MKRIWQFSMCAAFCCAMPQGLQAQKDSLWKQKPELSIEGFADVFYAFDFNRPKEGYRQPFLYNHNRHNEFNLNLGYIKWAVEHPKYRSRLALQAGTYANDNYAAEPGLLKHLFEANVGLSLNRKNNIWLDAGILPSHIGFESAISTENLTLTRSLLAENSPYFFSGAKLSYHPGERWQLAVLVVNGWQRIQRLKGCTLPAFGSQLTYTAGERFSFNWSTFVGTDDPDSTRRLRFFNNFYARFNPGARFVFIAGFDLGLQQTAKGSGSYNLWLSPVLIGRVQWHRCWKTALRVEYYRDPGAVIIAAPANGTGFEALGLSLNTDYSPIENVVCRLEGRWLYGAQAPFIDAGGMPSRHNVVLLFSIAARFSHSFLKP